MIDLKLAMLAICGALWALAVGEGAVHIARYDNTPGAPSSATAQWPITTALSLASDRDTLVMFVHPKCPCSEASVQELAKIMLACRDRLGATVVFFRPDGASDDWAKTGLWKTATATPGVRTQIDSDAALAREFDAQTSGQVFVYEPSGRMIFSGGITDSRGHAGDNAGEDAVVALATGQTTLHSEEPARAPVFGCAILEKRGAKP
jgi:hypothetical protein